ncbi:putative secreted protein [Rhodopirellula maiorica SM1]|uniref:Putative secreted protein n=1 Tax=Rhodopirellula maiorica SM1 TaxID=1265738 RepID=M5RLX5_9BACT|nr:hypothetical protein [Rhodopirellula maiorica]EMI16387.1 putative secreted protein [Rhodopirellula maiorica SM1]
MYPATHQRNAFLSIALPVAVALLSTAFVCTQMAVAQTPPMLDLPVTDPSEVGDEVGEASSSDAAAGSIQPLDPLSNFAAPNAGGFDSSQFDADPGFSDFAATRGSYAFDPTIIGDFFGGGFSSFQGTQTVTFSHLLPGTILPGGGVGSPNSTIAFEVGNDVPHNDIFTTGTGFDSSGNGSIDTFFLAEPLPSSDAPTSPGPGFVFDPSTATAVHSAGAANPPTQNESPNVYFDGDKWFLTYSYTGEVGASGTASIPVPGPGVSTRRVKVAENFSPAIRHRVYVNYSFFNDAFGGLGDISRYTLGVEKVLFKDLISIEFRLPTAATYGSTQTLGARQDRNFEIGNLTIIPKAVLKSDTHYIWSAGLGISVPTADDTRLRDSSGQDLLVVENESVHLLPFSGLLYRVNEDVTLQTYMQLDIAANGDPIRGNRFNNTLPVIGKFTDSTLMHLDVAATQSIYRNQDGDAGWIQQVLLNTELHYTATLQDSDMVSAGSLRYSNLANHFNIVNATTGFHLLVNDKLVVTPAISIPLRDGLDEQFDYEAMVQINYMP